ncbi:MAG: RcnB family protein [Rhizomicrobium sp.]
MKNLFICATALGLFMAVPAAAAPKDDHQGDNHQAATHATASHAASGGAHQSMQGGGMTGGSHTVTSGAHVRSTTAAHSFSTGAATGGSHTVTSGANVRSTTATHSFSAGASSNTNSGRSGNSTRSHVSVNSLRLNVQASHHFHNGSYNAPQGYQSRHWSYGDRLPRGYFIRDYWLTDYLAFGLFDPPPGLIWVRVGDDALLIDEESGDIVQVDYGVFY